MTRPSELILAAVAIVLAYSGLARAEAPLQLRTSISDQDGAVTLGELFENAGPRDQTILWNRTGPSLVLDAATVQAAVRRHGLVWSNPDGLRRVIVRAGSGAAASPAGAFQALTWARNIATGESIQPEDLTWSQLAAVPAGSPRDPARIVGQIARFPLRQGAAVGSRDLTAALVIRPGDSVEVVWSGDGISLSMQGKATVGAAIGQAVTIQNPSSRKVVEAVATGPGQALIGPGAGLARSSAQIAAR